MNVDKACVFCGGVARFGMVEHVVMVGNVRVAFPNVMAHKCDACGEVEFELGRLIALDQRASARALREVPEVNGSVMRHARKAIGATQAQVAKFIGVKPETVSRWETGALEVTRQGQVGMLAAVQEVEQGGTLEVADEAPSEAGIIVPERLCA